jgi:hypothetical protein
VNIARIAVVIEHVVRPEIAESGRKAIRLQRFDFDDRVDFRRYWDSRPFDCVVYRKSRNL